MVGDASPECWKKALEVRFDEVVSNNGLVVKKPKHYPPPPKPTTTKTHPKPHNPKKTTEPEKPRRGITKLISPILLPVKLVIKWSSPMACYHYLNKKKNQNTVVGKTSRNKRSENEVWEWNTGRA